MDVTLCSPSFTHRLHLLCAQVFDAQASCRAAIKWTHNEAHLSSIHRLLDVHEALLQEIRAVDETMGRTFSDAFKAKLTETRMAINAWTSTNQTLAVVLEHQQKLKAFLQDQMGHFHLPLNMVLLVDDHLEELKSAMRDLSNCMALQSDRQFRLVRQKNQREVVSGRAFPRVPAEAPLPHRSTDY